MKDILEELQRRRVARADVPGNGREHPGRRTFPDLPRFARRRTPDGQSSLTAARSREVTARGCGVPAGECCLRRPPRKAGRSHGQEEVRLGQGQPAVEMSEDYRLAGTVAVGIEQKVAAPRLVDNAVVGILGVPGGKEATH